MASTVDNTDNNPAKRLWTLLTVACSGRGDANVQEVFASVLGIAADDTPGLFRSLALAHELIGDIEQKIRGIEGLDYELFLDWVPNTKRLLAPTHLGVRWEQHKNLINIADLKSLQHCAHTLKIHHPEKEIPADDLQQVLKVAQELEQEILDSSMPAALKSLLLEHVDTIRRAVREYKIRGASGIKKAFEAAVGALALHQQEIKNARDGKAGWTGVIDRTLEWLERVETLLALAMHSQPLLPAVLTYGPLLLPAVAGLSSN